MALDFSHVSAIASPQELATASTITIASRIVWSAGGHLNVGQLEDKLVSWVQTKRVSEVQA